MISILLELMFTLCIYTYYLYGLELSLLWLKINKFQIISISNSSKNIYVSQINVHM